MFGYLNTGNPRYIGETEAQEIKNARIDQGYLEYAEFPVNSLNGRSSLLPNGKTVTIGGSYNTPLWAAAGGTPAMFGLDKPDAIITNLGTGATTSRLPTITAAAYGSQPYPAGTYEYALTLYDPDTGEESIPAVVSLAVGVNQVGNFANFPAVNDLFPGRTNLQWRIYRRPLGGSEYLLVNGATVISANSLYAGPYQDAIADASLGILCDSLDNGVEPLRANVDSVILHNDMLFVGHIYSPAAGNTRVMFSKQGEWWAFPTENELNIPAAASNRFLGFAILNEQLVLLGQRNIFVLYGDNVDNFALKEVDFDFSGSWPALNAAMSANGIAIVPIVENATYVDGSYSDAYKGLKNIAALDGAKAKVISDKINNLDGLQPLGFDAGMGADCAIIDNRFYVIKLADVAATYASVDDPTTITDADAVYLSLVFDMVAFGWLTADDSGVFTYRTKEFSLPRQVQFHKRIWIEAEGTFTLQFLGDGNVVTELTLTHATKTKAYYNIKARRYDTFSFRFVGNQDCKIYDFGVDE